jgi:hypothetical protein
MAVQLLLLLLHRSQAAALLLPLLLPTQMVKRLLQAVALSGSLVTRCSKQNRQRQQHPQQLGTMPHLKAWSPAGEHSTQSRAPLFMFRFALVNAAHVRSWLQLSGAQLMMCWLSLHVVAMHAVRDRNRLVHS